MKTLTLLLLPGSLVARRHVDDAVSVDVEGDLDLGNSSRGRRNANLNIIDCKQYTSLIASEENTYQHTNAIEQNAIELCTECYQRGAKRHRRRNPSRQTCYYMLTFTPIARLPPDFTIDISQSIARQKRSAASPQP